MNAKDLTIDALLLLFPEVLRDYINRSIKAAYGDCSKLPIYLLVALEGALSCNYINV